MSRVGTGKSCERVLTDDELVKVWRAGAGPFGTVTRMLILTGARREEITQLRWSEVTGNTIRLEGDRTKTGTPYIIPLSAAALALLDGLPRIAGSDFVFTRSGEKPISGGAARRLSSTPHQPSPTGVSTIFAAPWRRECRS